MHNNRKKIVKVVFRLDDYSALSHTAFETWLIRTFRSHGWSCLFGVIPLVAKGDWFAFSEQLETLALDARKIALLKTAVEDGTVELALHGLTHQSAHQYDGRHHSELAGLTYAEQYDKLKTGKNLLEQWLGLSVDFFVPPWNSYDSNTLQALSDLGFHAVFTGKRYGGILEDGVLKFLPATCKASTLQKSIEMARRSQDDAPVVVVMLHEYLFKEVAPERGTTTYAEFEALCNWIQGQDDLYVVRNEDVIEEAGRNQFKENHAIFAFDALLPERLRQWMPVEYRNRFPVGYYRSDKFARSIKRRSYTMLAGYYGVLFLGAGALSFSVAHGIGSFPVGLRGVWTALAVMVTGYVLRNGRVHRKGALALTLLVGATGGLWLEAL